LVFSGGQVGSALNAPQIRGEQWGIRGLHLPAHIRKIDSLNQPEKGFIVAQDDALQKSFLKSTVM